MKPTAEQAIKYLSSKTNDRTFLHKDNKLFELFDGDPQPHVFAYVEELHWMKDGAIGARGYDLWPFNTTHVETEVEEKATETSDRKPTKAAQVLELVKANKDMPVKDLVQLVIKQCQMTEAGARTYIYNAKKAC